MESSSSSSPTSQDEPEPDSHSFTNHPPSNLDSRPAPQSGLLNHHPSINFNSNATPVPSFPRISSIQDLMTLKRKSEAHFLNHISAHASPGAFSPSKPDASASGAHGLEPTTLRFVDHPPRDQSDGFLPYPDPDVSIKVAISTPTDPPDATTHARRISTLPARATPDEGSSRVLKANAQANEVYIFGGPHTETIFDPPLSPRLTAVVSQIGDSEPLIYDSSVATTEPIHPSPSRQQFASPAAAISATVSPPPRLPQAGTTTMDQMWAEMQTRANLAPGIGKTLAPHLHQTGTEAESQDENRDRFQDTHLKTFSKVDDDSSFSVTILELVYDLQVSTLTMI